MDVADAWSALLAEHHRVGSPLERYQRPGVGEHALCEVETELGLSLPAELAALYRLCGGSDSAGWARDGNLGWAPQLLGNGLVLLAPDEMVVRYHSLRSVAAELESTHQVTSADALWLPSWLPVFSMGPAQHVVADTADTSDPAVLVVDWAAAVEREVCRGVASVVRLMAQHFRTADTWWDTDSRVLDERRPVSIDRFLGGGEG